MNNFWTPALPRSCAARRALGAKTLLAQTTEGQPHEPKPQANQPRKRLGSGVQHPTYKKHTDSIFLLGVVLLAGEWAVAAAAAAVVVATRVRGGGGGSNGGTMAAGSGRGGGTRSGNVGDASPFSNIKPAS